MSASELWNVKQLADFLGVKVSTVQGLTRRRTQDGDELPIPYLKIGRRVYFRRASVERWIAAREKNTIRGAKDGKDHD